MEDKISRRSIIAATAATGAAAFAATSANAETLPAAEAKTPITDSLDEDHAALLTESAKKITEGDAVLLNRSMRDPDYALPDRLNSLTKADMDSLMKAFQESHSRSFKVTSLAPSLVGTARAGNACCCCTPASCCCAAAQGEVSRSRRIA